MLTSSVQKQIAGSELLIGCSIEGLDVIVKAYKRGQQISDRLEQEPSVGIILQGIVDVYSLAEDGTEVKLSELQADDCFGICNIFAPSPLDTVLKCRTQTEIAFISKNCFAQLIASDPTLAIRYSTLCNRKIQFLLKRIELLTMQSCRGKLISYLLNDGRNLVLLPQSKEHLAKMLGVSRAALFRELAYLQKEGLIHSSSSAITIINRSQLERLSWHS